MLTVDVTRMTSPFGLIRMLMWHHGGMIRGTWHVPAACWRALDGCQHMQARGEHMKTCEMEGRHFRRRVFTPAARGKEGLLSDGAWKSVKALMMKISLGTDRSGDVLHRSGVRFLSLKAKKEVWQAVQFIRGKVVVEPRAPEPGLLSGDLRIGRPARDKRMIGGGTGLGPA
uniref:Uncharacterized protein n=1 Tax=Fagus sylvatica TaxID=28930 RepID=A0A2N9J9I7_FAGSY